MGIDDEDFFEGELDTGYCDEDYEGSFRRFPLPRSYPKGSLQLPKLRKLVKKGVPFTMYAASREFGQAGSEITVYGMGREISASGWVYDYITIRPPEEMHLYPISYRRSTEDANLGKRLNGYNDWFMFRNRRDAELWVAASRTKSEGI